MSQRRCGTCRHFQSADAKAQGTCQHPSRTALRPLVQVRAQELGCRQADSGDLWEARPEGAAAVAAVNAVAERLVAPAQAMEADGRRRVGYQGSPPTVAVATVELPHERELDTNGIPVQRSKGTVAEIHSRARKRLRPPRAIAPLAEELGASEVDRVDTDDSAPILVQARSVPSAPRTTAPSTSVAGPAPRPSVAAQLTVTPDRVVPPVAEPQLSPGARADAVTPEPRRVTERVDTPAVAAAPRPAAPRSTVTSGRLAEAVAASLADEPLPVVVEPPTMTDSAKSIAPRLTERHASGAAREHLSADLQAWRAEWTAAWRQDHPRQCCGTCRDFRAAESPRRGWCTNGFAFPTRQFVDTGDLACLSGLGTWWLASDDTWRETTEAPETVPTPLADGLIQLLNETRRLRRRS